MKRGLQAVCIGVAAFFAVAAIGCGGGGAVTNAGETTLSAKQIFKEKYRFLWKATQVCKKGLEQADLAMHRGGGGPAPKQPSSAPEWESSKVPLKVVVPAFRRIASQLEALEPDKEDAYEFDSFVKRLREELKEAEAHPGAPVSSRPLRAAGKQANAWGLHACLF